MQAASCSEKTNKQWKGHSAYAHCKYITIKLIDLGSLWVIVKSAINCVSCYEKAYVEAGVPWWKVLPVREDLENNCEKCSLKGKTLKIVVFLGSNHICVQIPSGIQSVALLVRALASQTSFHFEVFNFQIGLLLGCWFTKECFRINVSKFTFTFY